MSNIPHLTVQSQIRLEYFDKFFASRCLLKLLYSVSRRKNEKRSYKEYRVGFGLCMLFKKKKILFCFFFRFFRYAKVAKEISSIIKNDFMSGKERAAFWVDHVIKYGGDYLRSPATELSFIQFYMIDVIAFLLTVLCIVLLIAFACLRFVISLCYRVVFGSAKSKKD